jgi:hypothetical protein
MIPLRRSRSCGAVRRDSAFRHGRKPDGAPSLAHVPAKWVRFADKDMRQHENLRRFPVILDHWMIQVHAVNRYDREAL